MGALRGLFWLLLSGAAFAGFAAWTFRDRPWTPIDRPLAPIDSGNMPLGIAVFGTSLTARGDWPDRMAEMLSDCLRRRVTVTRFAEAGADSSWGRARVDEVISSKPDIVLIEFAINDADLRDGLSLPDSILNHTAILSSLAQGLPEARAALMTMSPAFGPRGWMRPRLQEYYASYGDIAEGGAGTGVIDLYALWRNLPDAEASFPDGLHPDAGDATDVIAPRVSAAVAAAAGRSCN